MVAERRRRVDRVRPYADVAHDELTEAQRCEVQDVIAEQYHGRKDREAWDRRYWRSTSRPQWIYVRSRVRTGSQRGSPEWQR